MSALNHPSLYRYAILVEQSAFPPQVAPGPPHVMLVGEQLPKVSGNDLLSATQSSALELFTHKPNTASLRCTVIPKCCTTGPGRSFHERFRCNLHLSGRPACYFPNRKRA